MSELENDQLADKVADKVYDKIADTFVKFMANMEEGQKAIASDISSLVKRIDQTEKDIKNEEKRIGDLEKNFKEHQYITESIAGVEPTLIKIQEVFSFWTWKKIVAIVILFLFSLVGLFYLVNKYMHKQGYVTEIENDKSGYQLWTPEFEMKVLTAPTRGATEVKNWTRAQRDSIRTVDIKGMEIELERQNKEYDAKRAKDRLLAKMNKK